MAQLHRDLDGAVHEPEEPEVGDPDLGGGLGLLFPPDRRHFPARNRVVEPAGLAIGDETVGDLDAGIGELGHGSRGTEVDVIGVGGDNEDSFDLGELQHRPSQRPIASVLNLYPVGPPRPRSPPGPPGAQHRRRTPAPVQSDP